MPQPAATTTAASSRTLAMTLMGSLVLIVLALWFVLGGQEGALTPPVPVVVGQLVAGLIVHLALEKIGYLVGPLERGLDPDEATRRALVAWTTKMALRFVLSEAVALVSIVVAFSVPEGSFVVVAVGAIVSLLLMLVHVWPGARPVGKLADELEGEGQPSGLREAFGHTGSGAGGTGGAIQEL